MNIRPLRTIFVSFALVAALVPGAAQAATPAQIHADAADGEINGVYSMSELRAADRAVSAVQREYYGWDDLYREHIRALVQPTSSGDSRSESATVRAGGDGNSKSPGVGAASPDSSPSAASPEVIGDSRPITAAPAEGTDVSSAPAEEDPQDSAANANEVTISDSGSGFPLVFALMAIPLVVLAVGVWRSRSTRTARAREREALRG